MTANTNTSNNSYDNTLAAGLSPFWYIAFCCVIYLGLYLEHLGLTGFNNKKRGIEECLCCGAGWLAGNIGVAIATKVATDAIIPNTQPDDLSVQKALIALIAIPSFGIGAATGSFTAYNLYKRARSEKTNPEIMPVANPQENALASVRSNPV